MNKIYRVVWDSEKNAVVVCSELDSVCGGSISESSGHAYECIGGFSKLFFGGGKLRNEIIGRAIIGIFAAAIGCGAFIKTAEAGSLLVCNNGWGGGTYSGNGGAWVGSTGNWYAAGQCANTYASMMTDNNGSGTPMSPTATNAYVFVGATTSGSASVGTVSIVAPSGFYISGVTDFGGSKATNLAAGTLSASSTDVVNGSQLYSTNSTVTSLSTSVSTGLSTTNSTVTSLSTSASTGISTAQSGVNSLSTGLSTTNSTVTSLSTSASTGI
ncbi:ESPR-type extended signal peptide-containing protein, partial [Burkholderia diffusa]|uniref:ESPR-type extended signal peptide-containing protein n=1 Tax=Burkholderia diffusa TaxID=488732 RepID=UPI003AF5A75F